MITIQTDILNYSNVPGSDVHNRVSPISMNYLRDSDPLSCLLEIFKLWWRYQMETFPRYWPFVRGMHRSPLNYPHKGQWRGALKFSLICALNKQLSKQSWSWWFETPLRSLWRHYNAFMRITLNQCHFDTAICVINIDISYRFVHICSIKMQQLA